MKNWLSTHVAGLTLVGPCLLLVVLALEIIRSFGVMSDISITTERAQVLQLSNALLHEVQKERGMTAGFIGSNGVSFKSELTRQRQLVDSAYQALTTILDENKDEQVSSKLGAPVQQQLSGLSNTRRAVDGLTIALGDALRFYTKANSYILEFNGLMAKQAEISLFKQKFSVLHNIGYAKEASGIERALLSNAFANGQFSSNVYNRWLSNTTQQQVYLKSALTLASDEFLPTLNNFINGQSNKQVQQFRDYANAQGMNPLDREATQWFAAATARINDLKAAEEELFIEIIDHAEVEKYATSSLMVIELILMLIVLWLTFSIYSLLRVRKKQGRVIRDVMISVAHNQDLTQEIPVYAADDLGKIAESVNLTLRALRDDFTALLDYATQIATASEETAATTEQTRINLNNQRKSVAENVRSAESLSTSIAEDIISIGQVSENAGRSRSEAEQGADQVSNAVSGIKSTASEVEKVGVIVNELNTRVNDILGMVDVIRSVAEQTNLLALNAAIEAARAGEQGRGFAVVADEVRALAQRTQESTEQISVIVDELTTSSKRAIDSVDQGNTQASRAVELAEEINSVLQGVSGSMVELDNIAKTVAASSDGQQRAVNNMNDEMRSIDLASQENAEGAQYIASAANELSSIAADMLGQINRFKV